MKAFLARLASSHPLALIAGACLIALTIPTYRAIDALPRAAGRQGELTREYIGQWLTANVTPQLARLVATVDGLPPTTRDLIDAHATRIERIADARIGQGFTVVQDVAAKADTRTGEALGIVRELQTSTKPLLDNAALLAANYAALPDRLGAELLPSWLAIQPEITCRQLDGSGYGGCWHSRVTALMGEAARVGGVFTQHFPSFVATVQDTGKQVAGITTDVHSMTTEIDHRYFHPPPQSLKQRIWGGFKNAVFLGASAARLAK